MRNPFSVLFERRSIGSSHELLTYLMGRNRSKAGPIVNEKTAMNVLAVLTCVSLRSRALSSLPCKVYENIDARSKREAPTHAASRLLKKPNPWQTRPELIGMLETHRVLRGNAYAWKNLIRNAGQQEVAELIPLHPDQVEVVDQPDEFGGPTTYKLHTRKGPIIPMASAEVLHLKGLSTDGRQGRSVLDDLREAIGGQLAAQDYANGLWNEDGVPRMVLTNPHSMEDQDADAFEKKWQETYGGGDKRRVALLEEGMDIKEIALKPSDAQFLQTTQDLRRQIYGVMHVPAFMASDTEKSTSWGTGVEQQQIGFLQYTMGPDLANWEARLDRDVILDDPDRFYIKFSVQAFLRGDSAARALFYTRMWQLGVCSINDILAFEDMNPIPGGDVRFVPLNYQPLGASPVTKTQKKAASIVVEILDQLRKDGRITL